MGTQNLICLLLLLFLGTTLADIAMQENLNQIATEVVDKVEEFKEKCCEGCHHLVEVICETREDWWTALLAWLRSLGGSKGICDILQRLLDFTNSLIHLVLCHLDSKPDPECSETFVANKLAWLKEQDVANTDQLNFTKALLVTVVILVHLAFSILILVFVIPFICNCVGCLNTKVEEVVARTRGTGSSRRTTSTRRTRSARRTTSTRRTRSARRRTTSRRSSRKATPARRTHSTKDKLSIFAAAQVAGCGNLDLAEGKRKVKLGDAKVTGYEGYNKKSFLELPTTSLNKATEQSSSSSGEEPVRIVIKENIRKRPASKKSSSKKSSSQESN